ncbi:MAG: response regulator [Chlamydiales bacterium]|jgi:CheY-like chemotaxis protein|nr:response regulator [Chlamydiales bacterium]
MPCKSILLVEDNPIDCEVVMKAIQKSLDDVEIVLCEQDNQVFTYLSNCMNTKKQDEFQLPSLIMLDFHLSEVNGGTIIEKIKSNPILRLIPIVVISGSSYLEDVRTCYELGISCYLPKSLDLNKFEQSIQRVILLFLSDCILPH